VLLKGYSKVISRPRCNSNFESLHCIVRLNEDIRGALPYLSSLLGGTYIKNPPSVSLKVHGRLIGVHPDRIAINALRDEAAADNVIHWITEQINHAWENRDSIDPDEGMESQGKPVALEILKLLPISNCGKCGHPTCMVFALQAAEGIHDSGDCPSLDPGGRVTLSRYLGQFRPR